MKSFIIDTERLKSFLNIIGVVNRKTDYDEKLDNQNIIVDLSTLNSPYNKSMPNYIYSMTNPSYKRKCTHFLEDYHNVEFINILSRRLNGFNWFDIYVDGFKPSEEEKKLGINEIYPYACKINPSNIKEEMKHTKSKNGYYVIMDIEKVLNSCHINFNDKNIIDLIDLKDVNYFPLWIQIHNKNIFSSKIFTLDYVLYEILQQSFSIFNDTILYQRLGYLP